MKQNVNKVFHENLYNYWVLLTNSLAMRSVLAVSWTGLCKLNCKYCIRYVSGISLTTSTAQHCDFTLIFQCRRTTQQEIWPWESLFEHSDWFFTITVTSPCLLCVCQFRWVCDGWKSSNNSLSTGTLFLFFRCASSRASLSPNAQAPVVQARSTLMSWLTEYLIDYLIIIV